MLPIEWHDNFYDLITYNYHKYYLIDISYKLTPSMNPNLHKIDSHIKSHTEIIKSSHALNSKTSYSINCLLNSIEYNNANRLDNITYIKQYTKNFIAIVADKTNEELN